MIDKIKEICNKYKVEYIGIQHDEENKPLYIFFNISNGSSRTIGYSEDITKVEENLIIKLKQLGEIK